MRAAVLALVAEVLKLTPICQKSFGTKFKVPRFTQSCNISYLSNMLRCSAYGQNKPLKVVRVKFISELFDMLVM